MKQSNISKAVRINNAKIFKTEQVKIYSTLRAARLAAAYYRKQDNVVRCNVFLKTVLNSAGNVCTDKRGLIKTIPALFIMTV